GMNLFLLCHFSFSWQTNLLCHLFCYFDILSFLLIISQDEVQIEVVQLRAVRILAAATRLITATKMPVYVVGVTSTQTPFSFSNANPGLTFHWSVSKRDVLDLVPRHSEVFLQLPVEHNFAMVVHTKAAGRTSIKVTVHCMNSSSGQFEGNLLELSDEVQILVFEKLQLFYPECQPEQILMPINSQLKLHTNREGAAFVSSRVLKCFPNSSVIEEDGEGLLKAGSIAGTAVLEVTSIEPFGVNQTTITGVQVAPVTYLRVSSQPKLYTAQGRTLSAFPLGMSLTFTVEFYNSIGEKFHTHSTQLYLALNRDDLLLIGPGHKNYTYMAQAVNRGLTLVGLWDRRHPGMADYIPVAVEHAIEPDAKLTFVGDVICFSTHLVSQHGEPGIWMISADNILQTDIVTGVGVARSPGTAMIFHDIPGVVKTYREVVVNASSRLMLSYDLKTYLTNTLNSTVFELFITTGRNGVNLKGFCTPNQALAITKVLLPATLMLCHVQFSNTLLDIPASKVFHVHSDFSMEKDHCEDSAILKRFTGSHQILLLTLFAVLASTAFIFLAYDAFLNKIQTVPAVYVSTLGTPQPGSFNSTSSPPHFMSLQPPLAQSRLQHWLWSIRH
uniref:Nucleoporin 210 like n=1 Tax=Piliocolobus tephrosceles TaxID=591936 RepID=A0A8C9IP52_9PRIM